MNPIENERSARNLEMMIGTRNTRGAYVMTIPTPTPEKPEFVVETFHIDPKGKMSVTRPGPNGDNA